ncbi:MAG: MopE-related protein [bacterium]
MIPASAPATRICNGIDDDCDGSADEGLGLGQPCGAGQGWGCAARAASSATRRAIRSATPSPGSPAPSSATAPTRRLRRPPDEQALGRGRLQRRHRRLPAGVRRRGRQPDLRRRRPRAPEARDAVDNDCDGRTGRGWVSATRATWAWAPVRGPARIACNGQGVAACNAAPGSPRRALQQHRRRLRRRTDEQAQGPAWRAAPGVGACLRPGTRQCVAGNLTCERRRRPAGGRALQRRRDDRDGRTDGAARGSRAARAAATAAAPSDIACVAGALAARRPAPAGARSATTRTRTATGAPTSQPDCDAATEWDACDLQFGRQRDCDGNGVPDACDIQGGAPDCDGDGILDACNDACAVDVTPPVVNLFVQGNPINRGTVIQIVVQAQDDVGVTACALTIAGQNIPLDAFCQAFVNFAQPGYFDVVGTARDAAGNEGRQTVRMRVLDPNDVAFPELTLHAPPNGSTIRQPTDVVASVQDANLVEWILSYGPQANPAANIISRGGQNVANQAIGVLDPAVIPVGQWALRLYAEDINGRSRTLTGSFTIAACVPAAEVCDGRDNDCDQRIDEQPVDAGGPCTAGEGVSAPGTVQCVAGATTCDAVPGQPAGAEACNRLDDDCDGRVDESQACPDVSPPRS